MNTMTESPTHILVVEDEPKLGQILIDYLQAARFKVSWISHGNDVQPYLKQHRIDLILLDLMLPGTDGITLCQQIRQTNNIPIMILTAKTEEADRLSGLEVGADDYICKPFSPREVVARVKTILRRCALPSSHLSHSSLLIDESRFYASYNHIPLELTSAEFRLLKTLAGHPDKIFSRDDLLNHLYDDHRVVTDRTIDSHIKNLRRKLEQIDRDKTFIRAVYGMGYRWEADVS